MHRKFNNKNRKKKKKDNEPSFAVKKGIDLKMTIYFKYIIIFVKPSLQFYIHI